MAKASWGEFKAVASFLPVGFENWGRSFAHFLVAETGLA